MKREELLETDKYHAEHLEEWMFLRAAHAGYRELIKLGLLDDFRDSAQYENVGRGLGFSYSAQIVELTTGFISQSQFVEDFSAVADHPPWAMFESDCDLLGTDFDAWWNEARVIAAVYGFVGVLTTQPGGGNPADMSASGAYPYISMYAPHNILSRKWERDPVTGRPILAHLKLRQYDPDSVLIWTREDFETWDISGDKPFRIEEASGPNALGEIPFTLFFRIRNPGTAWDGVSLIQHVAPIDANIVRSAIRADKIEHMAAFPMFVRPRPDAFDRNKGVHVIGPEEVTEFDPETPSAKPYWLAPEADRALAPILESWKLKKQEIYEMAFLQSLVMAGGSKAARSADSQRQLFRFLEARLASMVTYECEARRSVVRNWLKWQNMEDRFAEITIEHSMRFDVEGFIAAVEDMLTEDSLLGRYSPTARKEIRKRLAERGTLRNADPLTKQAIYDEIDDYPDTGENIFAGIPPEKE